jgi:hypothetical protein
MKTITIQIGNSDDKLTQMKWAHFYADVNHEITQANTRVHFAAPSPAQAAWQNACWVIEIDGSEALALRATLSRLREQYQQDSIAWTEGQTAFV